MSEKIYLVGNKVDIPEDNRKSKHNPESKQIVFVGKMSYEPNVVAVTFFVDKILPKLRVQNSHVSFTIVGANPDSRVIALQSVDGVSVTGFVDSIEPYFQNAAVVVAPMLTGAGIQNKIIQAMSYGCCVVTTPIGAEGLNIMNDEIAICNDEGEMVDVISRLLEDVQKRERMGDLARQYVINNMASEIIEKQFWDFIGDDAISD